MKKKFLILAITIPLATGIIFTGYRSSAHKQKPVRTNILNTNEVFFTTQEPEESVEWVLFRQESDSIISSHEKQITELKTNIENNKELFDELFRKKVAILGEKINFIKARLEIYDKSPGNWESFSYGIKLEMDSIEKTFVELTSDNNK
jgi:hypothetical protein